MHFAAAAAPPPRYLDVGGLLLLLLPEGQLAQEVEESADLLRRQAVHVVQGSL